MKRTLVIYRSKYGATKRYAGWLQEALDADLLENKGLSLEQVKGYDAIVLAGAIMASGIKGMDFLEKHAQALKGKRLYALAVGASPEDPEIVKTLTSRYAKGYLSDLPIFYARGAWDVGGMTAMDRAMCTLLYKSMRNKPADEVPSWAKALVENWHTKADWTDKSKLMPLIDRVLKDQAAG